MNKSTFFSKVVQSTVSLDGVVFKSPFFIRNAQINGAFFLCDFQKAKKLLGPEHHPIRLPFNKTLFSINCIEYTDTDIGSYNEVAISIVVTPPYQGLLKKVVSLRSLLSAKFHAYVIHLPVSTELSVLGGKGLLHYPKFLADISFRETGAHRICTLRDQKTLELILEFECPDLHVRRIPFGIIKQKVSIDTYVKGHVGANATFQINIPTARQAFLWPRVGLRLGKNDVALQLKNLEIGTQVVCFSIPQCEGMLIQKQDSNLI